MAAGAAISAIENIASVTNLIANLIIRASCFPVWAIPPAAPIKPRFAQDIPEEISLLENGGDGSTHRPRLEFPGMATKYKVRLVDRWYDGGSEHGRRADPARRAGSRAGYCAR
jgi:hypothetical protein